MLVLLALTGCWTPGSTGPSGMVGVLKDEAGKPLHGIRVESIEGGDLTSPEGRFAVQYKAPEQYVKFNYKGVVYKRMYQEGDPEVVELQLPPRTDYRMKCMLPDPCRAEIVWDLGGGFIGEASGHCKPGITTQLTGAPVGPPSLKCLKEDDGSEMEAEVQIDGDMVFLRPPAQPIRVELTTDSEEGLPDDCKVLVGDNAATDSGAGFYAARAFGQTTVTAVCAGRQALPKIGVPGAEEAVVLNWSPTGPVLDLKDKVPDYDTLLLIHQGATPADSWNTEIARDEETGAFPLPPLPAGVYRFGIGDDTLLPLVSDAVDARINDKLIFEKARDPTGGEGVAWLSGLRLTKDKADGELDWDGLTE